MDKAKLKALVHYICHKCHDPTKLGKTKLNKILFYSDFEAFLTYGHAITGERYIKHQHGPVSEHIQEVLSELEQEGAIVTRDVTYHGYRKKEYISLYRPSLEPFSADEISVADEVINIICNDYTAKAISEQSHNHIWEAAAIGEEIPYETAFVSQLGEIGPEDIAWAYQELKSRSEAA